MVAETLLLREYSYYTVSLTLQLNYQMLMKIITSNFFKKAYIKMLYNIPFTP